MDNPAYLFFNDLFNKSRFLPGRVTDPSSATQTYELVEGEHVESFVNVSGLNGFAIGYDENFSVKDVFNRDKKKGYTQRCDYILCHCEPTGKCEIFLLEMKGNCSDYPHVVRQLQSGVAFLAFCRRMGIDHQKNANLFNDLKVYAGVLTQTASDPSMTDMDEYARYVQKQQKEKARIANHAGVICVSGHKVALDVVRMNCQEVFFGIHDVNAFPDIAVL